MKVGITHVHSSGEYIALLQDGSIIEMVENQNPCDLLAAIKEKSGIDVTYDPTTDYFSIPSENRF